MQDAWELREQYIQLPSSSDGYARLMFLGTTGAGKTTVIRQLVGTEPDEINFPAVSSSRTTTCQTEFIFREAAYSRGIVTFIGQTETLGLIAESVWEAFKLAVGGEEVERVALALLTHPEQRFRLYYVLGRYRPAAQTETSDPTYPDQTALQKVLQYILDEIKELAQIALETRPIESGQNLDEVLEDEFRDWLRAHERFRKLVGFILKQIKQRFDAITVGQMQRDGQDWPLAWKWETPDKRQMLGQMLWFAGNNHRYYGQLLAPLVNGIRLEAPFKPQWWTGAKPPALVLLDGEGIGHDSKIMTSLPIEVVTRFREVDVIVVVDNATQPMLDIPKIILGDAALCGQQDKIAVTYTRFDQVEGADIADDQDRREKISNSQTSALTALRHADKLNARLVRELRQHLKHRTFFFTHTHDLKNPPMQLRQEMQAFIVACTQIAATPRQEKLLGVPVYDYQRLQTVVSATAGGFMDKWLGLLGLKTSPNFPKQPWSRIKALANRFANFPDVAKYADLTPADDLAGELRRQLHAFLSTPLRWEAQTGPTEDERQAVVDLVAGYVSGRLNDLIYARLKVILHKYWVEAYQYKGSGSARQRAATVVDIYEQSMSDAEAKTVTLEFSSALSVELQKMVEWAVLQVQQVQADGLAASVKVSQD